MCGIAGVFHLETSKPVSDHRIRAMAEAQAHRGPDGAGVWTAPGIGLGHRRLAVIDLQGGAQPLHSADGRFSIVFNGEIYNYQKLRSDLIRRGHVFQTAGDTEVILEGFRQWGVEILSRLHGMFAFALYDNHEKKMLLARDRLGVKPLHYTALGDGSVAFSSELKGLMAHPGVRRTPQLSAVDDYFAYGYVPDDTSMLAGVQKLPAGHYVILTRGRPLAQPEPYWDVDFSQRSTASDASLEEECLHLFRQAVASRIVADVPVGAFLSGGVDSSSVVALMSEISRTPVRTCSIGFEGAFDESPHAAAVAERFLTDHATRHVASDDFALLGRLAGMFDEPFADASALPTLRVCELARERVTVALSGDGADEAFAGYRRHQFHHGEERARALLPKAWRQPVFGALGRFYPKADWAPQLFRAKTSFQALALEGPQAYARSVGILLPEHRAQLFSPNFMRSLHGYRAEERYEAAMRSCPARTGLDQAQYADLKIWLPGDILTKVDRTSMSVGLEVREPLLDHRLIEFAARLPTRLRTGARGGKILMKRAMAGHLPQSILYRRKMGFVTPISAWLRGPLSGQVAGLARKSHLMQTGWFNAAYIDRICQEHQSGRANHGRLLWQLLMFEAAFPRLLS